MWLRPVIVVCFIVMSPDYQNNRDETPTTTSFNQLTIDGNLSNVLVERLLVVGDHQRVKLLIGFDSVDDLVHKLVGAVLMIRVGGSIRRQRCNQFIPIKLIIPNPLDTDQRPQKRGRVRTSSSGHFFV